MLHQDALINEMGRLRKFALRLTKNAGNAEDLLQSTMLRGLEKAEYFEQGTNLFSWTSKIMFNLFISDYRRKSKFETQYDPAPHIEQMTIDPSQEMSSDLSAVGAKMKLLSSEHREVLMLVCVREMGYDEAAKILRIPVGTVRSRLSRARSQLQDLMRPLQAVAIAA